MGLLLLCCSLLPTPDDCPFYPPLLSAEGVSRAAWLAKGRVLATFLCPGMTREQVERILGEPSFRALDCGAEFNAFGRYGIQVFWTNTMVGKNRGKSQAVQEVRYVWACWAALFTSSGEEWRVWPKMVTAGEPRS